MRRFRSPLALVLALASAMPAAGALADDRELRLGERAPIAVVLAAPTGDNARVRSSEIIRVLDELLRARTDLALQLVEASALAECKGRLLCLVEKVGGGRSAAVNAPSFLLVLSNVTRTGEPDRLNAQLLDVERANATIARGIRDGEAWQDEVEAALNEQALATERAAISDIDDAERVVAEWLERRFAPALEAAGHWEPYGEVVITTEHTGLEITFDGQAVGATAAGRTRVREVRAGERTLVLVGPMIDRHEAKVTVHSGEVVEIEPELSLVTSAAPGRGLVMMAGLILATGGVVATVASAVVADGGVISYCFVSSSSPDCSDGSGFVGSGFSASAANRLEAADSGGVLLLPLGYSLLAAGATWSIGAWLDDDGTPWIPMLAGVGVGVLAYAVSAAASSHPGGP